MAHYARVNAQGIVEQVIVADETFIEGLVDKTSWVQTSYNTRGGVHYGQDGQPDGGVALRKNYAGIGYTYSPAKDAFIPPQPYPSWTLDDATCLWQSPVPYPNDGKVYVWDEQTQTWVEAV